MAGLLGGAKGKVRRQVAVREVFGLRKGSEEAMI